MDKASIIRDAIEYIEKLQAEERRMLQEDATKHEYEDVLLLQAEAEQERKKKIKRAQSTVPNDGCGFAVAPPVEVLELRVSEVGDRVLVVSVTCGKRRDAMARVCRAIEELQLRVITANVTSVAGCLMHTVFVEVGIGLLCFSLALKI
jgi:pentose-5-phosphate-3-epimerase